MPNYMTKETYSRLLQKLERINNIEIPCISKEKLEAARQGDLSENAEYEAAKEKLEFLQNRFFSLQERLNNPIFIDNLNIPGTIVSIGTIVTYRELENGQASTYTILGTEDSNLEKKIISFLSPIGKGLVGKKIGDECEIQLPEKTKKVIIENIQVYTPS